MKSSSAWPLAGGRVEQRRELAGRRELDAGLLGEVEHEVDVLRMSADVKVAE